MKFTQLFETSKPRNFSKSGKPSYPKRQYSNSTIAYIQGLIEDSLNAESELEPETQNVQDGLTQNKTMLYDEDNLKVLTEPARNANPVKVTETSKVKNPEKTETLEKAFSNLENGHTDHFLDMPDESEKTVVTPNEDLEEFQRAMDLEDSEDSENASEKQENSGKPVSQENSGESGESSETKETEEQKDYFLDDPDEEVSEESKEIASRLARNLEDNSEFYLDSEDLETEPVTQDNSEDLEKGSETLSGKDPEEDPETDENDPVSQENSGKPVSQETPKTPKKSIKESKKPKRSKKAKLTEESKDSKELKDEVQDVQATPENPEAIKIYNELIDLIQKKDYDETVDFVDDIIKDPKLKFLLSLGFGGDFSNLKLKLKRTTIPAKRLVPTQNEIGTNETLRYIIEGKDIDVCFEKSTIIKKPIVTFQGTFIVDGHHRWSQIFVTNPDANIVCIDITGNLSPLSMLKAVQCTIGSNTGKLIRKNIQGQNLYDVSEKEISKYLEENLSESVLENLEMYYENPVESLTKNVIQMQRNNTPILNAPDRGEMPQTSKDPELFDDLKNGVTDV